MNTFIKTSYFALGETAVLYVDERLREAIFIGDEQRGVAVHKELMNDLLLCPEATAIRVWNKDPVEPATNGYVVANVGSKSGFVQIVFAVVSRDPAGVYLGNCP
jgi:hypothetical protein